MTANKLYGAILGDLAGQPYEFNYKGDYSEFNIHNPNSHITDDSIMTLATAAYMLGKFESFEIAYKTFFQKYQGDLYGSKFREWCATPNGTVGNSFGNGCLMRVSPCMYYADKKLAKTMVVESAFCSHLHPESLISILYLANLYREAKLRKHVSKFHPENHIKYAKNKFYIKADDTVELINHLYWITDSTHDTIKDTVLLGGDTDTNASIVGELMNFTFNDLTQQDKDYVESKLDSYLLDILISFNKTKF